MSVRKNEPGDTQRYRPKITIKKLGSGRFVMFLKKDLLIMAAFIQKYRKNSNIAKYYCNLKLFIYTKFRFAL